MSSVWQTQHRVHFELLRDVAEWLGDDDSPKAPELLEEHCVRLLAAALRLLRQHQVNRRGRCRFCGWTRWKWRFWRRRPRCTVHHAFDLALGQDMAVVWWCVFETVDHNRTLADVRAWLVRRAEDTMVPRRDPPRSPPRD